MKREGDFISVRTPEKKVFILIANKILILILLGLQMMTLTIVSMQLQVTNRMIWPMLSGIKDLYKNVNIYSIFQQAGKLLVAYNL